MEFSEFIDDGKLYEITTGRGDRFAGCAEACTEWFLTYKGRGYQVQPIWSERRDGLGRMVRSSISDLAGDCLWLVNARDQLQAGSGEINNWQPHLVMEASCFSDAIRNYRYMIFTELLSIPANERTLVYGNNDNEFSIKLMKGVGQPKVDAYKFGDDLDEKPDETKTTKTLAKQTNVATSSRPVESPVL